MFRGLSDGGRDRAGEFSVQASAETLACTTIGEWDEGTPVNLEKIACGSATNWAGISSRDTWTASRSIVERRPEAESVRFVFEVPDGLERFIASKGSVALDGVSLTVNEVSGTRFGVNIIPHTLACTNFGAAAARPADEPRNRSDSALCRPASRRTRGGGAMNRPPHLLLVEAPYYAHIADHLRQRRRAGDGGGRRHPRDHLGARSVRNTGGHRNGCPVHRSLRRLCRARLRDQGRDDALRSHLRRERARACRIWRCVTGSPSGTAF